MLRRRTPNTSSASDDSSPTHRTKPGRNETLALEARSLVKDYRRGSHELRALHDVSLDVPRGEFLSIMGPSGSGKSTMLHLLGALDKPSSGSVYIDGTNVAELDDDSVTDFRRRSLGFVFQFFNLLPTLTAWENVALPLMLDGARMKKVKPRAVDLMEQVGLGDRVEHRPAELSGGQLQRVAIARALVTDPVVVLADEPTGALDQQTGLDVLALLRETAEVRGTTIVMVTHDRDAAEFGHRVVSLADGQVRADERTEHAECTEHAEHVSGPAVELGVPLMDHGWRSPLARPSGGFVGTGAPGGRIERADSLVASVNRRLA